MTANEALAKEDSIRRKLRWHEMANTLAIVILLLGIVTVAAVLFARSNALHPKVSPARAPQKIVVAPPPLAKAVPAAVPTQPSAPASVSTIAFVDPRPKLPPQPEEVVPKPKKAASESRASARELAPSRPEPAVVAEVRTLAPDAIDRPSGPAAKRVLVSIKCFEQFAFERQAKGRQYFSALCENGFRREVSCQGAGCRIDY